MQQPIAVLGAGSWGSALALQLARLGHEVRVWSIDPTEISAINTDRANNRFLPGFPFPDNILAFANLEETVKNVNDILIVVPSVGYRSTLEMVKPFLTANSRIVSATKGLDAKTSELPNHIVEAVLGKTIPFAVLSGPSFAREVAAAMPTAVVIASENAAWLEDAKRRFDSPDFRVFPSTDVVGVEVGGVIKNVIAIAIGISDGLGLGSDTRSAILTFALAEITRLGVALGGKPETFTGLSGMGDLILTCLDDQSRNRRFGLALGRGKDLAEAEREIGQAVEGKRNAALVTKLAEKHHVHMPICQTVQETIQGKLTAQAAITKIFNSA